MSKKIFQVCTIILGAVLSVAAQLVFADINGVAEGEKLYKNERCESCHGANLQGSYIFPDLLMSPKTFDKWAFKMIVFEGARVMPQYKANGKVVGGIDYLFEYINSVKALAR